MPAISSAAGSFGYGRSQVVTASSGDKIVDSLTTSLATYNAASNGQWVKITQTEYDTMSSNVTGTVKATTSDTVFNLATSFTLFSPGSNVVCTNAVNAACPAIPANTYMYAMKIRTGGVISNLKAFTNNSTATTPSNFIQAGSTLPATSSGIAINYYVLKGVSTVSAATTGTLAVQSDGNPNSFSWGATIGGVGVRYLYMLNGTSVTSSTILNSTYNSSASALGLQCLTTGTKQWA